MDKQEKLKQLSEHLARHIENSHRGYEFPNQKDLADYIYCGICDYEYQHINQKVTIIVT